MTPHCCTIRPQNKQIQWLSDWPTAEFARQAWIFWQLKSIARPCNAWASMSLPLPNEIKLLFSKNTNADCLDRTDMSNAPHQHPQQPRSFVPSPMRATGFPIPTCSVAPLQLHLITGPHTISFSHVWQQKLTSNSKYKGYDNSMVQTSNKDLNSSWTCKQSSDILNHTLSTNYFTCFYKHGFLNFGTSSTEYRSRNVAGRVSS